MDKLIEQIKADREAGTKGALRVFSDNHGNSYTVAVETKRGRKSFVSWMGFDYRDGCTGFRHALADANRIARVPDMEARILADAAIIKAAEQLETYLNYAINGTWLAYHPDAAREALAAYRAAVAEGRG